MYAKILYEINHSYGVATINAREWIILRKKIDGQNILYHYFQKNILKHESALSSRLFERLLIDLSIWIPPSFCKKLPIILPYVVRDPSCRVKRETGEDEWGSANEHGFLRDDNTLIKGLVRSFDIRSPTVRSYDGFRLGRGFVASHIWRNVRIKGTHMISSRHYKLNSFVPNLAWLPIQISKLTDREGSLPQRLLQAISHKIYREISLPREILNLWEYLPFPEEFHDLRIDVSKANYFVVPDKWLKKRVTGLISEIDRILSIDGIENEKTPKIKSRRYLPTLLQTPRKQRMILNKWLAKYRDLLYTTG